jgi:hypothetical protein
MFVKRSTPIRPATYETYEATSRPLLARCTAMSTYGCSGAIAMYVAPNTVSTRVVKAVNTVPAGSSTTEKETSDPVDLPIHSRCSAFDKFGQSSALSPSRSHPRMR